MTQVRTAIVGAGPAGLAAAWASDRSSLMIFEPEPQPGGLCRSFELAGAVFDYGGHAFFTTDPDIEDFVVNQLGIELYRQPRQAWVHAHGRYVRYPYQNHLHGLPADVVERCVRGVVAAAAEPALTPADFLDWMRLTFGEGICETFLRPYNEKLWAHPLTSIAPSWTGDRIVTAPTAKVITGALLPAHNREYPNAVVRYPTGRQGYAGILAPLVEAARPHLVAERVTAVNPGGKWLETDAGRRVGYDHLVVTMPLPELARILVPADPFLTATVDELRHNSLALVSVVYDRWPDGERRDYHRVYSADPDVPFHKLAINTNSTEELRAGPCGMQAEVSYSAHKTLDRDTLVGDVVAAIERLGLVPADRVVATDVRDVRYAYPVQTHTSRDVVERVGRYLRGHGIHLAGRFAEWRYVNIDGAFKRGLAAADAVAGRGA